MLPVLLLSQVRRRVRTAWVSTWGTHSLVGRTDMDLSHCNVEMLDHHDENADNLVEPKDWVG